MTVDKYPQFLGGKVVETAANTFTQVELSTPVIRSVGNKGQAYVMNILKIFYTISVPDPVNVTTTKTMMHVANKSFTTRQSIDEGGIIAADLIELDLFDTAATDATVSIQYVSENKVIDFTDNNGHGILYANSKIYLGIQGVANTGIKYLRVKILYTLVKVGANELLGMLAD